MLRQRQAGPQQVDVRRRLVGLLQHGRGDAGEHVLERDEDRLVGGSIPEGVDVDLELRAPGGDERLLLAAEVVVERPDGDVRGGRDVVAVTASSPRSTARRMTALLMAARVSAFLRSRSPVVSCMPERYPNLQTSARLPVDADLPIHAAMQPADLLWYSHRCLGRE